MLDFVAGIVSPFDYPERPGEIVVFANTVPYIEEAEAPDYLELVSRYAFEHCTYVVSGLYSKNGYLCLALYDSKGRYIGEQRAFSLSEQNQDKFSVSDEMWIFDTGFCKLFMCVDEDIYNDDVLAAAINKKNCDLIISSQYIHDDDFDLQNIINGPWWSAQKFCRFVVHANNKLSSIISPCSITKRRSYDGFLCQPSKDLPMASELYSRWLKYAKDTNYVRALVPRKKKQRNI